MRDDAIGVEDNNDGVVFDSEVNKDESKRGEIEGFMLVSEVAIFHRQVCSTLYQRLCIYSVYIVEDRSLTLCE